MLLKFAKVLGKENVRQGFYGHSAEFVHSGNKNKLSDENRKKILEAFKNRKDIEYFSKLMSSPFTYILDRILI